MRLPVGVLLMILGTVAVAQQPLELIDYGHGDVDKASDQTLIKSVVTNPRRIYPPSCLPEPLPSTPRGIGLGGTFPLLGLNLAGAVAQVRLDVWREPCGPNSSAIMVKFERISGEPPFLPSFLVSDGTNTHLMRLGTERNTLSANSTVLTNRSTFVMEYSSGNGTINMNGPLQIVGAYLPANLAPIPAIPQFTLPAYNAAVYGVSANDPSRLRDI